MLILHASQKGLNFFNLKNVVYSVDMKNNKTKLIIVAVVVLLFLFAFIYSSNKNMTFTDHVTQNLENANSKVGSLSNEEINGLVRMREEEKLARDVYLILHQKWNARVFSNITGSEQTHTSRVKVLLDKYNIPDPVTDDSVGAFTNPSMKKLFDDLTAQGMISLEEALKVGVLIEEMDIKDLDQEIAKTSNAEIINVYQNLKGGSENHLRAFSSNLKI